MKTKLLILSTGFALFSMFFGSGNLVFPLAVGRESDGHFFWAALGICITGVLVPFLGAWAMMLFQGDTRRFFGVMGKTATFWLTFVALSLMGPFGVLARCITVAHGNFKLLFPDVSLTIFSIASCLIIYLVTVNKSKIVTILGSFLTPFLLLSLVVITGFGVWFGGIPEPAQNHSWESFRNGFLQGYQTMDLIAAFFFSSFVLNHLANHETDFGGKSKRKIFLQSALLGGTLLSAIYVGLVFLGAIYAFELQNVPAQEMLGIVSQMAIGRLSAPIVCIAVVLACFTTAVVLATLFADFLKTEVARNRISDHVSMGITLIIAFLISTLDFAGIARFLAPILEAIYPALIVLTILNICTEVWGIKSQRWPVVVTLVAKVCYF